MLALAVASIALAFELTQPTVWIIHTSFHTHNLKTALGELLEYTYNPEGHKDVEPTEEAFFEGYMRENGTVGVRNEVWIIPTVGCVIQ